MWCLPLIILIGIAIHHRWRIHRIGQSSWKGGGFSMFSEMWRNSPITELWTEDQNGKPLHLQVADQQGNYLLKTAVAIPTEKHLLEWARWVAGMEWKRCGDFAHLPSGFQSGEPLPVAQVTVHHRSLDFDSVTGIYSAKDLRSYTLKCQADGARVFP